MQIGQENHPGDKRPGFLGVLEPELPKNPVTPQGTGDDTERQEAKRKERSAIGHTIEQSG